MMEAKTRRRPRGERVRRVVAAQTAPASVPLRAWHVGLFGLALLLAAAAFGAPGVLADLAAVELGSWRGLVTLKATIGIVAVYALVFIRSYHALVGAGLVITILGLALRIGQDQITQEPLTLGLTLLLLALAVLPIRVITRPNDAETIRRLEDENRQLREQLGEEDR